MSSTRCGESRWRCLAELAAALQASLDAGKVSAMAALRARFSPDPAQVPQIRIVLGSLRDYDVLAEGATAVAA